MVINVVENSIDDGVIRKFMHGSCMNFALALKRTFGYRLGYIYSERYGGLYENGREFGIHVVGIMEDGRLVDVRGVHTMEAMMNHYAGYNPKFVEVTEEFLKVLCEDDGPRQTLQTIRPADVKHAYAIIRTNSSAFVAA